MGSNVKIKYINSSGNKDNPTVFVFTKNEKASFDSLADGVAWRVLKNIGKGSSTEFVYTVNSTVQAMWGSNNKTAQLTAEIGSRYSVVEDSSGIVLKETGDATSSTAIEVDNKIHSDNGIQAQICKDGRILLTENIVAFGQKATFVLHPKLYWGIASEIYEGQSLSAAVLNTDQFQEQDLEGLTESVVRLTGNARDGYTFEFE